MGKPVSMTGQRGYIRFEVSGMKDQRMHLEYTDLTLTS